MVFDFICRRTITLARPCIKLQLCCHGLLSPSSPFTITPSDSCSFHSESAILASKHVDLSKSPNTANSVHAFLNNQGFTNSQVLKLISRYPRILCCDIEKILLPNFATLNSIGLSSTELVKILTVSPSIMFLKNLQDRALPCVDYLKTVLGSDDNVINAIKRFPLVLTYDLQVYAAENIRILQETGVPISSIVSMISHQPRSFFTSADRFRKVVEDVKEMGFDPSKIRFLLAIHALRSMSQSTWDKKMELYKKWGWSKDEIFSAFERYPWCMMASTDKISSAHDFYVNSMGWEISYIVQWPIAICFSLEKRVIPRCMVYQYLAEKGLTEEKDGFCFNKWLMYSEMKFLQWVTKRYEDEAPELLKLYHKHMDKAKRLNHSIIRKRDVV